MKTVPDGVYRYQKYGTAHNKNQLRREGLYAIGGLPMGVKIEGLTKAEAEKLLPQLEAMFGE